MHTSDSISDSGIGKGGVEDDDDSFQSVAPDDFAETGDASAGATLVVYGIFCGIGFVVIIFFVVQVIKRRLRRVRKSNNTKTKTLVLPFNLLIKAPVQETRCTEPKYRA